MTAVYHVEVGRPETQRSVERLLECGASYDLESAVARFDVGRTNELLSENPLMFEQLSTLVRVKLVHNAIDDANLMSTLLKYGGDPNACDSNSSFAYPPITRVNSVEVAKILLASGADETAVNAEGLTRYQIALKNNEGEILQLLRS